MVLPGFLKNEYKQKCILAAIMPIFWITCTTQVYPIAAMCLYFMALTFFTMLVNTHSRLKEKVPDTAAPKPPAQKAPTDEPHAAKPLLHMLREWLNQPSPPTAPDAPKQRSHKTPKV